MADGTAEDYALLRIEDEELRSFPDRVLGWLLTMDDSAGYQISRLDHSLQAATRAHRAGEDEETVVCALLHDIGDYLAPANHSEVAAAMLRPYVSEKNYWIVKHHGVFQGYYYFHHAGRTPTRATAGKTTRTTRRRSTSAPTTTRTPSIPTTRQSPSVSSLPWCGEFSQRTTADQWRNRLPSPAIESFHTTSPTRRSPVRGTYCHRRIRQRPSCPVPIPIRDPQLRRTVSPVIPFGHGDDSATFGY